MGEQLKVPDHRGVFVPIAVGVVLLLVLIGVGVMLYVAGQVNSSQRQILANQSRQDKQWSATMDQLKDDLSDVRRFKEQVLRTAQELEETRRESQQFMVDVIERQARTEASLHTESAAIKAELHRQSVAHELLKDYTEGRISGMPYRQPPTVATPSTPNT